MVLCASTMSILKQTSQVTKDNRLGPCDRLIPVPPSAPEDMLGGAGTMWQTDPSAPLSPWGHVGGRWDHVTDWSQCPPQPRRCGPTLFKAWGTLCSQLLDAGAWENAQSSGVWADLWAAHREEVLENKPNSQQHSVTRVTIYSVSIRGGVSGWIYCGNLARAQRPCRPRGGAVHIPPTWGQSAYRRCHQ